MRDVCFAMSYEAEKNSGWPVEQALMRLSRGVALLDPEGRVTACNKAFAQLLGFPDATAVVALDLQRHVADDDRAQYRRAVARASQSGAAAPQIVLLSDEAPTGCQRQRSTWVKLACTRLSDQPGERRLIVELSSANDARRRQAETLALQQRLYHAEQIARDLSDKSRSAGLDVIEHRVRLSITSMVGYAESLHDERMTPSARDEAMQAIRDAATKLLESLVSAESPSDEVPPSFSQPVEVTAIPQPQIATSGARSETRPGDAVGAHKGHSDPLRGRTFRGRVLVVEDSKDNQRLMMFQLRRLGLEVDVVDDGLQAVQQFNTTVDRADLILLDMQMPQMDGYQTAQALRERGYTRPIVALTANVKEGDRERCLAAGCSDYLGKPIDRRQLASLLCANLPSGPREDEPVATSLYYDAQPVALKPVLPDSPEVSEAIRKLHEDLPAIAASLWSVASSPTIAPGSSESARRVLGDIAGRARAAGAQDIASLADEAETSIRLGADASVVHQALGRLLRTISRGDPQAHAAAA